MSANLSIENLVSGYGTAVVLDGVTLNVPAGSTLAILGRNGVGKTTLFETIMGLTTLRRGAIKFDDQPIEHMPTHRRARLGLGYVPQQREIFASLSVVENLQVCFRPGGWTIDAVFDLFPHLKERQGNAGNHLSGGEQQMLAVGRALVGGPKVLLLDEPLEGLAPIIVETLVEALSRIRDEAGMSVIMVEQKAEMALAFAQQSVVLDRGKLVYCGPSASLKSDEVALSRLLGLGMKAPR
jgi:branched-chain amino acid transport system ATP-binding protein